MDSYFARREAAEVTNWVRELFPNGVDRYLDFACGTGRLVEVVGALARETIGVDTIPSCSAT
jgi:predicted TPR repeat methyltransferase